MSANTSARSMETSLTFLPAPPAHLQRAAGVTVARLAVRSYGDTIEARIHLETALRALGIKS